MRKLSYGFCLLLISLLAQAASAAPIRITYTAAGSLAPTSGAGPGVPVAGAVILEFPNGGDPTVGGAIDFGGQIGIVQGELHTTGAPVLMYTSPGVISPFTSFDWPAGALSFPYGTGFVNWVSPNAFFGEGTIVPGSAALDVTFVKLFSPPPGGDQATGGIFLTEFSRQVVPEPSTGLLLGLGLVALAARRSRRG